MGPRLDVDLNETSKFVGCVDFEQRAKKYGGRAKRRQVFG